MSYNYCSLLGYLTKDPQLVYASTGIAILNFDIAVTTKKRKVERTLFMPCVLFGNQASNIVQYLSKGSRVLVNGQLVQEQWQTQDGSKHSRIKLHVGNIFLLSNSTKSTNKEFVTQEQKTEHNIYTPRLADDQNVKTDDIPF